MATMTMHIFLLLVISKHAEGKKKLKIKLIHPLPAHTSTEIVCRGGWKASIEAVAAPLPLFFRQYVEMDL